MTTPLYNTAGNNVSGQFGMPLYGISGMLPFTGNYFWVDETNGSDGNTGGPSDPFATLTQALLKCTANNNDVVFMTGSVHVTATVAWSKSKTHLIGLSPPSQNSRARIAIASTASTTAVTPLVNVTGAGCIFQNIEVFNGVNANSAQVAWLEAGGQSYYKNCNFIGTGFLTAAAHAGNRSLSVASDENLFEGCTIGGDTILRATGNNATMDLLVNPVSGLGAARNVLRNCIFQAFSSNTANLHVSIGAGAMDRYILFDNCIFTNFIAGGGVAMTAAISANAAAGGLVLVNNGFSITGTKIAATGGPVYVNGAVPTAGTSSISVLAT